MARIHDKIGNFYINITKQQDNLSSSQQYEMIGKGNFGAVYLGKFYEGAQCIQTAVKIVPFSLNMSEESFEKEARILMDLSEKSAFEDSHVVRLYGYEMNSLKGYLFA